MKKKKEVQPPNRDQSIEENRHELIEQDIAMHKETGEQSPVDPSVRNSESY